MPELPEVERARRQLERLAVGRRIERVVCSEDGIVFDGVTPDQVEKALTGRRVEGVRRRGKYLWFELDRRPWPLFHFGMTGAFRIPTEEALRLASSPKEPERDWPPRFTKIRIHFDDGGEAAMTNSRRLGRIRLREDPPDEPPIADLGFDPLLDLPSTEELADLLRPRRAVLKGLLLDQRFAAGVGNWIADEVLYQAGIDPRRKASSLAADEVARLRAALHDVVATAVSVDAEKDRLPADWLFHRRWGREKNAETTEGEAIEHLRVSGRTTAWVPTRQS